MPRTLANIFSHILVDFNDQDTPQLPTVACLIYWPSSQNPAIDNIALCANDSVRVAISAQTPSSASSSAFSPENFGVDLQHTYLDNSVGQAPYNVLTKFAGLNLSWPGTEGYDCDDNDGEGRRCWSRTGTAYLAVVTRAIS
jgi:hypothetical protein